MSLDFHAGCVRLGLAVLNGLYQGIIISVLVAALLRFSLRTNAATRHAVWFASLWLVALLIPAHFWLDRALVSSGQQVVPPSPNRSANLCPTLVVTARPTSGSEDIFQFPSNLPASPASTLALTPDTARAAFSGAELSEGTLAARERSFLSATEPGLRPNVLPTSRPGSALIETNWPASRALLTRAFGSVRPIDGLGRLIDAFQRAGQSLLQPLSWKIESGPAFPLVGGLVLLWLCIAGLRLVILVWRLHHICHLAKEASRPENVLLARFSQLCREGRVRRQVALGISRQQRCPLVLGFFRPVVLLPADMVAQADATELDHVLRHELAHVRRYDDWANLAQHFVEALLFFHPSVWWINRRLSLEREIACDDHVLDQGGRRRNYALILTTVASRLSQKIPMLAPGVSNSNNQLQERIEMILNTRRNASPALATGWSASIVSATALVAVLALYSGPRLVLGASTAAAISADNVADSVSPTPAVAATDGGSSSLASADGKARSSAEVGPGPKFKAEVSDLAPASEDEQVEAPEPPDGARIRLFPVAPRIARAGKSAKTPRPPGSPDAIDKEDGSMEERLHRLEKMVAQLMDQQGLKHARGAFLYKDGSDMSVNFSPDEMEKLKQSTERQAARVAEQAQRTVEQARRATKDREARLEQERAGKGDFRESLQRELESLRKAREGLSEEMDRLGRQIEKIERDQPRNSNKNLDQDPDPERRGEAVTGKMRAQASVTPDIAR